ncbi:MAG: glycosyltransferase [Bacteroidales bacterium]|nr:glycosyltransferase [Bacteroidales bacterium]
MDAISIVVSVYNEAEVVEQFHTELMRQTSLMDSPVDVIYVDDGSTDGSERLLDALAHEDPRVAVVHLSRNYGHEAAMIAGIDHAGGQAVICMDADLQNPPACIPDMVTAFRSGHDVVSMVRRSRADGTWLYRWASRSFYRIINRLSDTSLTPNASDFFLVSRRVADILRHDYRERSRFLRGIIQLVGFPRVAIEYDAPPRAAGRSKYSLFKLLAFSVTAIASFSKGPLKLAIYAGVFFALLSLLLIAYSLYMWLFHLPVSGYTTLVVFLSAFASILFFILGIMGYYIGFIFDEVKQRPIYSVRQVVHSPNPDCQS